MFSEIGGPKNRAEQKEATRARILEVGRDEIEREGFDAVSLRGIAKRAGVSPGTVLLYFRDKQDLLHTALFDDLAATWTEARQAARGVRLEDDLLDLARAFFGYYGKRPALSRSLLRESMFAAPPWAERFSGQVAEVHAHVAGLVQAAKARGEIAGDADPGVTALAFLSFYYFALIAWVQTEHPDPLGLLQVSLAQHLNGLRPATRPQPRRQR